MKAHYRTRNGRIVFEIEAQTQKGLFREVAMLQDVFEADENCGACGSTNVRLQYRCIDANDYYSMACCDCGAELRFGQHKQGGTLFAKRTDGERGWKKYKPAGLIESESVPFPTEAS